MEGFPIAERLHTDVLEDEYGPITSNVVVHNMQLREAHLVDVSGITRTYALTYFPSSGVSKSLYSVDEYIRLGTPIGKAFRDIGYSIRKNVLDVFIVQLPSWLRQAFRTKSHYAKARISEFYAKRLHAKPVIYGTVIEIYAPDFRKPIINLQDVSQISATTKAFAKHKITKANIWNRIGKDNHFEDMQDIFMQARLDSLNAIFELRERVYAYLNKNT